MHPIQINFKGIFLLIIVTKLYALMKDFVSQWKHIEAKIQLKKC